MLPRFGGALEPLAEAVPVTYTLPPHASNEARMFFETYQSLEPEADFIASLPGGRVFGSGVVLSPDGCSLARDVSTDFGKRFDEHWLLAHTQIRPPVQVPGTTAVIAITLGENYCHWLLEELPRLLMLAKQENVSLIAHDKASFIQDALKLGGWAGRVITARRYSHFQCEHLLVPSLIGRSGCATPEVVRLVTEFTKPLRERGRGPSERIYITREKAERRRVSNEAALWSHLEACGFVKVCLEELSWTEQINAFAHAKVIVAPHGAGLANLVFCQPGARVIELFNRSYVNPCFWRLASVVGLDYRPLIRGEGEGLAYDLKAKRHDILTDIDSVAKALA